jgi:uncharacterized protein YjbI with pentapeptide repeats
MATMSALSSAYCCCSASALSLRHSASASSVLGAKSAPGQLHGTSRRKVQLTVKAERKAEQSTSSRAEIDEAGSNVFSARNVCGAIVGAATLSAVILTLQGEPAVAYIGGGPYGREVTRGQDLSGKDFSNRDLTQQDFKTSILRQANFKGAKLLGASFFDSDLTGADFTDTDLRGADFSLCNAQKVNFTNANFEGATVTGNTSFKGSIITGADFTDVQFREDQRKALCARASGTNPVTGNDTRETLFCPE